MASSSKSSLQSLRRAAPMSMSNIRSRLHPALLSKLSGMGSGQGCNFKVQCCVDECLAQCQIAGAAQNTV